MKTYRVAVIHITDNTKNVRTFYYNTNASVGEELSEELVRVYYNLGIEKVLYYSLTEVASLPFVSHDLKLNV